MHIAKIPDNEQLKASLVIVLRQSVYPPPVQRKERFAHATYWCKTTSDGLFCAPKKPGEKAFVCNRAKDFKALSSLPKVI